MPNYNNIYRMEIDCGRMGSIEGLFIATDEDVKSLIGKTGVFYEVLGKHSEFEIKFKWHHFDKITNEKDNNHVEWLFEMMGTVALSGVYPFEHVEEDQD